jgi:HSP20 family protein
MADTKKQTNPAEASGQTSEQSRQSIERTQRWPSVGPRREVSLWPFGRSYDEYSASPIGLLRRMSDEMDRMFSPFRSSLGGNELAGWSPSVEVFERDGKLIVHADLPGLSKEDVRIQVANNNLIIEGERRREHEEDKGPLHRSERSYGSFWRSIALPEGANIDQARAEFNNGVLEISIPIPEEKQARQIPIQAGSPERRQVGAETTGASDKARVG